MPTKLHPIYVLCGSTKFKDDFDRINEELSLANGGAIVLSLPAFSKASGKLYSDSELRVFTAIHLAKIELADAIYVINRNGYIGESTRNEIAHAISKGIEVLYMEGIDLGKTTLQ
jgi:hypothetical protein